MRRRLPPYGKQLLRLKPEAHSSEVRLFFGRHPWREARWRAGEDLPVLVLPPGEEPGSFRWPVRGWSVLALQRGEFDQERIPELGRTLIGAGASAVHVLYGDGDLVIYRKAA